MTDQDILDLRDRADAALAEAWALRRRSERASGDALHQILDRMHDQAAGWFALVDTLGLRLAERAVEDDAAARALARFNTAYPEIARAPGDASRPVLYPGDGSLWTADGGYIANAPGRPALRIEGDAQAGQRLAEVLAGPAG